MHQHLDWKDLTFQVWIYTELVMTISQIQVKTIVKI